MAEAMQSGGRTPATINICDDCLFLLAYGDRTEGVPAGHGDQVADLWGDTLLTLGCPESCCGEEPEPWFSWSPCDGCGSRLGGNRQHATVWEDLG